MLEDFINSINELIEYKRKYEFVLKDKQQMSDALYELYLEKYNNQSFEERKQIHINEKCKSCRYYFNCNKDLIPENILMPSKSDRGWFPPKVACSDFEWS